MKLQLTCLVAVLRIQMIVVRRHHMTRQLRSLIFLCIPAMFCAPDASRAELVRFEVVDIESPYFDGRSFGSVGQYEMITATATFAVEPETRPQFGNCRH